MLLILSTLLRVASALDSSKSRRSPRLGAVHERTSGAEIAKQHGSSSSHSNAGRRKRAQGLPSLPDITSSSASIRFHESFLKTSSAQQNRLLLEQQSQKSTKGDKGGSEETSSSSSKSKKSSKGGSSKSGKGEGRQQAIPVGQRVQRRAYIWTQTTGRERDCAPRRALGSRHGSIF